MNDRDWRTEALGLAALLLGWEAPRIQVQELEEASLKLLTNPVASRFGLFLDLALPYEPSYLMVYAPDNEAALNESIARFRSGERTEKYKLEEVKKVNKGHARGPVVL